MTMIASVGKYTYGWENIYTVHHLNDHKVYVGSYCSIASTCKIFLGGNHHTDWITTFPFGHIHKHIFNTFDGFGQPVSNGDVIIGNDVWIGENVTIMSGVKIGNGVVIATNSHIVKDIPDYAIIGGNPAKLIRFRFTEEQIEKLLKIQWWNWDDNKVNENVPLLCSTNIDNFINKHYSE